MAGVAGAYPVSHMCGIFLQRREGWVKRGPCVLQVTTLDLNGLKTTES